MKGPALSKARIWILLLGPIPIVSVSMALSWWARSGTAVPWAVNHVVARADELEPANSHRHPRKKSPAAAPSAVPARFRKACEKKAKELSGTMGEGCQAIAHAPFVIAGDLSRDDLEAWHRQTIGPAAKAMAASYFDVAPSEPITVLLFSGEASYNHYAKELFGDEGISVYGYYKPRLRTLVMNIGTGGGTLVHELTHALMDFDFPQVPDWFNEGLASLHEQCQFRPDGSGIDGLVNWRLPMLQEAIAKGKLRSLKDLISSNDFRGEREGLNYAQARYFCLYMQQQQVLEMYFHDFRAHHGDDPLGLKTVERVFPDRTWDELDMDFQQWAAALRR